MKQRVLVAALMFASGPALAVGPPGHPPWICHIGMACNVEGLCISAPATPAAFALSVNPNIENGFVAEGFRGDTRVARQFPSLEAARSDVAKIPPEQRLSMILVPTDEVADAHGFRVYNLVKRGTGEHEIRGNSFLVSCSSFPRR